MASSRGPASPLASVAPRPHSTQGVPPIRSSEPNRKPWISSSSVTIVTRLKRSSWSSMVLSGRGLPALRRTCDSSSNSAGLREAESRISTSMAAHSVAVSPCDESRGFPRLPADPVESALQAVGKDPPAPFGPANSVRIGLFRQLILTYAAGRGFPALGREREVPHGGQRALRRRGRRVGVRRVGDGPPLRRGRPVGVSSGAGQALRPRRLPHHAPAPGPELLGP